MHELFPDWMRTTCSDGSLTGTAWEEWAAALDGYIETATPTDVLKMTEAAFGHDDGDWSATWRHTFREADAGFPLVGQDGLVRTLAAAGLVTMRVSERLGTLALYAAVCAKHLGWDSPIAETDVSSESLLHRGEEARAQTSWKPSKIAVSMSAITPLLPAEDAAAVTGSTVRQLVAALTKATEDAVSRTQTAVGREIQRLHRPIREEAQMLRWLLSGYSTRADRPWNNLDPISVARTAAIELSELTMFDAGHPFAYAMLFQTVSLAGRDTIDPIHVDVPAVAVPLVPFVAAEGLPKEKKRAEEVARRVYDELRLIAAFANADE